MVSSGVHASLGVYGEVESLFVVGEEEEEEEVCEKT